MRAQLEPTTIDFSLLRQDFPLLKITHHEKPWIYLDSASSAQKPKSVIDAIKDHYENHYANIHRGIYALSAEATKQYEAVRAQVRQFIHASTVDDIVFVRGTTEGINLIAQTYGQCWQAGDEIILSEMEHHSNIVPWVLLKERMGIVIKVISVTETGEMDLKHYQQLFSPRTKLVSITHASNVIGTINPVKAMTAIAHAHQVPILIDGAQAVPHIPVDVSDIGCDFYVFSGHKLYGPTGIGVLCGKKSLLNALPPYQGGGGMIEQVSFDQVTFTKSPQKFEAGTPHLAGVQGLSAAMHYVGAIGMESILAHEQALLSYARDQLAAIPQLRLIGTANESVGVISLVIDDIHPHDVGTVLDHEGIAVRAGHHCAQPLMNRFQIPATVRLSLGLYNTKEDIDACIEAILVAKKVFE